MKKIIFILTLCALLVVISAFAIKKERTSVQISTEVPVATSTVDSIVTIDKKIEGERLVKGLDATDEDIRGRFFWMGADCTRVFDNHPPGSLIREFNCTYKNGLDEPFSFLFYGEGSTYKTQTEWGLLEFKLSVDAFLESEYEYEDSIVGFDLGPSQKGLSPEMWISVGTTSVSIKNAQELESYIRESHIGFYDPDDSGLDEGCPITFTPLQVSGSEALHITGYGMISCNESEELYVLIDDTTYFHIAQSFFLEIPSIKITR